MKKNRYNLYRVIGLYILLVLTSCTKFLELEPESSWDAENFYKNETEVELGLAGIYNKFAVDAVYGQTLMQFDSGTDEGYYNRRFSDGWPVGLNVHSPSDPAIADFWKSLYEAINLSNIFIEKIDGSGLDEELTNRYKGEARFLRAFAYFTLVEWFEDIPMPLDYSKDLSANDMPVTPMAQVYEQIIEDFDFASKHLLHPSNSKSVPGRAHKIAAHGMLARVYLKMAGYPLKATENYQFAKDRCDSVIMDGFHGLVTNSDTTGYRELFLGYIGNIYKSTESIFEISYKNLRTSGIFADGRWGQLNGLSFGYGGGIDGYPFGYAMLNASPVIDQKYDLKDKRKAWNLPAISCSNAGNISRVVDHLKTNYCPGKFRRWEPLNTASLDVTSNAEPYVLLEGVTSPNKNYTGINAPVIRYADILLMYAEADNAINGPTTKAIGYLDKVRSRAGLESITIAIPSAVTSKQAFFDELVDERMRELCFEGLRRMDLIRWELYGTKLTELGLAIKGSPAYNATNEDQRAYFRSINNFNPSKHTVLPFPQQEVDINTLLDQKTNW